MYDITQVMRALFIQVVNLILAENRAPSAGSIIQEIGSKS